MKTHIFFLTFALSAVVSYSAIAQESPQTGAPASWNLPVHDDKLATFFQVDRSEFQLGQGNDRYLWDTQGWIGTDYNKFWFKAEGEGEFNGGIESAEIQGLYSRTLTSFFDIQAGIRQDMGPGPSPTYAVIGFQGLAPYVFELDSALYLSDDGDLTARVEAEYDLLFTQRLIGQPRMELNFAAQNVDKLGIGSGLSTIEMGFRLRYEIQREIAPYIGIAWQQALGDTADYRRLAGSSASSTSFVAGIRLWF
jgi:copper resistance protein B